jgi:hypothetical protein
MSETLDAAPAVIEDAPAAPETSGGSMRDTMAAVLAKYPDRDEGGRFESRALDAPETETTTDQPTAPEAEPAAPAIEPPASWSAEKKAIWSLLPPDAQEYVAQRESEAHKAISEKGSRAAEYDAVEAAIGQNKTKLVSEYGSVPRAVETLVNVAVQAGQRPAEFIQWFAQQHRIDLSQLSAPAGNPAAPGDPQIHHLSQAVDSLQTQLQQQEQARTEAALSAQIREFSEARGADGKPMRPHFDAVRGEMAAFMQAGVVKSLDEAYTKAIRANDAVWAQVQAEQSAARQAAEQAKAAKIAADARRANSVNIRPIGAVAGSPVRGQTMRETMEAVAKQMMG